jgi:hypothetical protein
MSVCAKSRHSAARGRGAHRLHATIPINLTPGRLPLVNSMPALSNAERIAATASSETRRRSSS